MKRVVIAMFALLCLLGEASRIMAQGYRVAPGNVTNLNTTSAVISSTVIVDKNAIVQGWSTVRVGQQVPLLFTDRVVYGQNEIVLVGESTGKRVPISIYLNNLMPGTFYCVEFGVSTNVPMIADPRCFTTLADGAPYVAVGSTVNTVPGSGNLSGTLGGLVAVSGERFDPADTHAFVNGRQVATFVVNSGSLRFQVPPDLNPAELAVVRVDNAYGSSNEVPLVVSPLGGKTIPTLVTAAR